MTPLQKILFEAVTVGSINRDEAERQIRELFEGLVGDDEVAPQSETGVNLAPITGTKQRNDLRVELRNKIKEV